MRLFFFFIGFILLVIGCTHLILYLNLLTIGYTWNDFLKFIILNYPGMCLMLGLICITTTIFKEKRKKDEYSI